MVLKKESTSQLLNWHDADIENRFGLPAGMYTTPGVVGSVLFGSLMAGALLGILFLMKGTPIADFFFHGRTFSGALPHPFALIHLFGSAFDQVEKKLPFKKDSLILKNSMR